MGSSGGLIRSNLGTGLRSINNGLDQDNHDQLQSMVVEALTKLQTTPIEDTKYRTSIPNSLPLPKITIPKFDGDYSKWRQFYDLFLHMIHLQPISNVQKMSYLKVNLTGEAERLISYLTTTEENYVSAWTTLQERYNNKRILASTLVEKIISHPATTSSATSIKTLHDTTRECLLALNNIGIKTDEWDSILLHILIKKLDRNLHIRFEQSLRQPKELPSINDLIPNNGDNKSEGKAITVTSQDSLVSCASKPRR
ncbi:uncharacterized protein LOC119641505 [Glossina fuscipes]|uniref:Uncharacterized protein LOC119641505 n=1 Tax=Glossina fuscipes TaxID=7396 RepID=A0A9C5ZCL4_9MUSC|nr:uncharacterized protein LOC119641505 [Glossina fuscipes]